MSNRSDLLAIVARQSSITIDELADALPWARKKIQDTVKDCVQVGYAKRQKDDITGQPAYVLTIGGKAFLKHSVVSDTPADRGDNNDRSAALMPSSEVSAAFPIEGSAGHQTTESEGNTLSVAVDTMPTDKECCNAAKVVATTAGGVVGELQKRCTNLEEDREKQRELLNAKQADIEALQDDIRRQVQRADNAERAAETHRLNLESMCSAAIKFCGWIGQEFGQGKHPINLYECQQILASFNQDMLVSTSANQIAVDVNNFVDLVNSPPHYTAGGIECFDAIEAALSAEEMRGYIKGNAMKYIWREKHKGGAESIAKACWYLGRFEE